MEIIAKVTFALSVTVYILIKFYIFPKGYMYTLNSFYPYSINAIINSESDRFIYFVNPIRYEIKIGRRKRVATISE